MSTFRAVSAALAGVVLLLGTLPAAATGVFTGEPVAIGNGHARIVVVEGKDRSPSSISVVLSSSALKGLPAASPEKEVWEFILPMPADGPRTGYRHVMLDWNPRGHIPEGVYSVAHFDIHFYLIDNAERLAIDFQGPDRERAMTPPDPVLVPTGYVVPPDTAVDRMGLHGLDPNGPEFRGHPFAYSFLYGYHAGRLIFLEPMISLAHLEARTDVTVRVPEPAAHTFGGYYPDRYRIGFNPDSDELQIALTGLRPYAMQ